MRKNSHRETQVPEGRIKAHERALEWGRVKVVPAENFIEAHGFRGFRG